jgi:hypothetical protein
LYFKIVVLEKELDRKAFLYFDIGGELETLGRPIILTGKIKALKDLHHKTNLDIVEIRNEEKELIQIAKQVREIVLNIFIEANN